MKRRSFLKVLGAAVSLVVLPLSASTVVTPSVAVPVIPPMEAFVPEMWSREVFAILEEDMVIANLVHRDFDHKAREVRGNDRIKVDIAKRRGII